MRTTLALGTKRYCEEQGPLFLKDDELDKHNYIRSSTNVKHRTRSWKEPLYKLEFLFFLFDRRGRLLFFGRRLPSFHRSVTWTFGGSLWIYFSFCASFFINILRVACKSVLTDTNLAFSAKTLTFVSWVSERTSVVESAQLLPLHLFCYSQQLCFRGASFQLLNDSQRTQQAKQIHLVVR